jgi:hypothetical protein
VYFTLWEKWCVIKENNDVYFFISKKMQLNESDNNKELSNDLFEENSENDFSEIDEQEEIAEEYRPIKDYENYEASNLG